MNVKATCCTSLACAFAGLSFVLLFNRATISGLVDTVVFALTFAVTCLSFFLWHLYKFFRQSQWNGRPLLSTEVELEDDKARSRRVLDATAELYTQPSHAPSMFYSTTPFDELGAPVHGNFDHDRRLGQGMQLPREI